MKRYNRSSRRTRILELMRERAGHQTAYEIFEAIRHEYPTISLGTVYRNLAILSEREEIRKIDSCGEFDRFDTRLDDHYHFICDVCREIFDLGIPVDTSLEDRVRKKAGHSPTRHRLEFYGTCKKCHAAEK